MLIIGELINGMYKDIGKAIKEKNKDIIKKCALAQVNGGADALDVNCGPASKILLLIFNGWCRLSRRLQISL